MTTQSAMEPTPSRRGRLRAVGLLVAVLAAFAGIFGFAGHDTANAVVTFKSPTSSPPTCADYTYCLEFDSAMNGRAIDSIWWGHTTQQEAVTTKFDKYDYYLHNHLWGVYFPDNTYKDQGSFELRSIGQPGWCLKEPSDRTQLAVSPCNDVPGHEVDPRQVWYLAPSDNADRFSLRSTWDGKCADILNNSNFDGAWVGAWNCSGAGGSSNQQWTIADWSGTKASTTLAGGIVPKSGTPTATTLAHWNKGGMARYARALNLPGRIRFCNWGGFVAEGVIEAYEYADNGQKHSWSTPVIPSRQCATFNVPKGTPIAAHITMHIWAGMYFNEYNWIYWPNHTDQSGWNNLYPRGTGNDDIVATYDLSAPYTNTTFNFYGTTCNATTGVTQDDFLSAQVSTVADAHEAYGCQDAGEGNGGSGSGLGRFNEALETVEDLFDVLGSLIEDFH